MDRAIQPESATAPSSEAIITLPPHAGAPATDAAQSVPMAAPPDQPTRDWFDRIDWVLLGLIVALSVLVSSVPAFNADVWMHLATGKQIAAGQYLPGGAEPFSIATEAAAGHDAIPWINHSWLYSLGLYLLYGALGGMGVIIVKGCLLAALTIVLSLIRNRDTHLFIVVISLTLTVLALSLRLLLQPVIVSYLLLGVTLLILHRAGVWDSGDTTAESPDRSRWLWALPVLCVLWVNLDYWFVLGPLVVGLSWVGLAVQRWRGWATRVPVGRLGVIFAACLVACLVSPFHVRVFQLPPELAYLLVRASERIHVTLPDAIVGGGRTLAALQQEDPTLTLSPFAQLYRQSPTLGYTIAGVCFYPLLALGLLSFLINGILGARPGGPVLQPARFLVWLFFAVLASLLQRLIPFFAIVAGPILALNLGDLLAWLMQPAPGEGPSLVWAAPVRLGKLVSILVLAALLLLAWPGWLTGPQDIGGRLHVGWDIPVNESLRRAAEALAEPTDGLRLREQPARVFSTGPDFACYCAYFAGPAKAKGFVDARYNLFAHVAADFVNAKRALKEKQKKPMSEWTEVFERYRVNHAAVENFLNSGTAPSWWSEPGRWRERFADKTVAVFAWSGKGPHWPGDAVIDHWNRLAFGPVPDALRPAPGGVPDPQNRSLLDRFLMPPPALPQPALDMEAKLTYGAFVARRALEIAQLTLPSGTRGQVLPMYSLPMVPLEPGTLTAPWTMAANLWIFEETRNQALFWNAGDALPPAVPILALRSAWRAAAAVPDNERCYIYLAQAVNHVYQQEDYWVSGGVGVAPLTLRGRLRRVQLVSALRAAEEVGIINPALRYKVYRDLAEEYFKYHAIDLSAEYLAQAEQELEAAMPEDRRLHEDWSKEKKQIAAQRKMADAEVKKRRTAFDLKTAGRSPMEKIMEANYGMYRAFTKDNREEIDPQGWGLTGMTLQLLEDLDPTGLERKEELECRRLLIELTFRVGRARDASQLLSKFEQSLGPIALQYQAFRAAAQGNYGELARALKELDSGLAALERQQRLLTLAACAELVAGPGTPTFAIGGTTQHWLEVVSTWRRGATESLNSRTLRGIIALEAGETDEAQRLLMEVLHDAGNDFFTERTIAERYAALLRRYQPR